MRFIGRLALASIVSLTTSNFADAVGHCKFIVGRLQFEGSPAEQAKCLLSPVAMKGVVGKRLAALPDTLAGTVGTEVNIPREAIRRYLSARGLSEANVGGSLDAALSRAHGGRASAPVARYFVIHDTSSPYMGDRPFPADDDQWANSFDPYKRKKQAHLYNNRLPLSAGSIFVTNPLDTPRRATRFEVEAVGVPSKGLFIHVENVQPRRKRVGGPAKNDNLSPVPGFTTAQYEKLALLYVVASRRAGTWMIPAYHAVLDLKIGDHDDPQNFDLREFDNHLGALIRALRLS